MSKFGVALIAHDSKKEEMLRLARRHRDELGMVSVVATKGTGELVHEQAGLTVTLMKEGPHGGDQQIGALVAQGEVEVVIFLRDPMTAQPHEPDIGALLRICDVHDVPLATNPATAEALLFYIAQKKRFLEAGLASA